MSREIKSPTLNKIIKQTNDPAFQINRLAKAIHDDAEDHALWDDFREEMKKKCRGVSEQDREALSRFYSTAFISGELSEMRMAYADRYHYGEEAADVFISLLSTCVEAGIDIGAEVVRKMKINKRRPKRHGKETFICSIPKN